VSTDTQGRQYHPQHQSTLIKQYLECARQLARARVTHAAAAEGERGQRVLGAQREGDGARAAVGQQAVVAEVERLERAVGLQGGGDVLMISNNINDQLPGDHMPVAHS
jgi:hypothetical protein